MPRMRLTSTQRAQLSDDLADLKDREEQLTQLVEVSPDIEPLLKSVQLQRHKIETLLAVLD